MAAPTSMVSKIQCICCQLLSKFFTLAVDYYTTACSDCILPAQVVVHKVTTPPFLAIGGCGLRDYIVGVYAAIREKFFD